VAASANALPAIVGFAGQSLYFNVVLAVQAQAFANTNLFRRRLNAARLSCRIINHMVLR